MGAYEQKISKNFKVNASEKGNWGAVEWGVREVYFNSIYILL